VKEVLPWVMRYFDGSRIYAKQDHAQRDICHGKPNRGAEQNCSQ
jgi:hypothetical protein